MAPPPLPWFSRTSRQEPKGDPRPRRRLRRGSVPDRPQPAQDLYFRGSPLPEQREIPTSAQDPDHHDTSQPSPPPEGAHHVDMRDFDPDHLPPEVVNPPSHSVIPQRLRRNSEPGQGVRFKPGIFASLRGKRANKDAPRDITGDDGPDEYVTDADPATREDHLAPPPVSSEHAAPRSRSRLRSLFGRKREREHPVETVQQDLFDTAAEDEHPDEPHHSEERDEPYEDHVDHSVKDNEEDESSPLPAPSRAIMAEDTAHTAGQYIVGKDRDRELGAGAGASRQVSAIDFESEASPHILHTNAVQRQAAKGRHKITFSPSVIDGADHGLPQEVDEFGSTREHDPYTIARAPALRNDHVRTAPQRSRGDGVRARSMERRQVTYPGSARDTNTMPAKAVRQSAGRGVSTADVVNRAAREVEQYRSAVHDDRGIGQGNTRTRDISGSHEHYTHRGRTDVPRGRHEYMRHPREPSRPAHRERMYDEPGPPAISRRAHSSHRPPHSRSASDGQFDPHIARLRRTPSGLHEYLHMPSHPTVYHVPRGQVPRLPPGQVPYRLENGVAHRIPGYTSDGEDGEGRANFPQHSASASSRPHPSHSRSRSYRQSAQPHPSAQHRVAGDGTGARMRHYAYDAFQDVIHLPQALVDGGGPTGMHKHSVNASDHNMDTEAGDDFEYSHCTGRKRALCIGINYTGQDHALHGCINDAEKFKKFLIQHYGYKPNNILLLVDTDEAKNRTSSHVQLPTRSNMLGAMKWLVQGARKHDSLVFHYSGHGSQVKNENGHGFHEAIYPVDYKKKSHILDDEMFNIMVQPLPTGCRLTAIYDSCHSGTALGLPFLYHSNGLLKYRHAALQAIREHVSAADVISFSGCTDEGTSADTFSQGVAIGAMSNAFVAALEANHDQSYRHLLIALRAILKKYKQKPQLSSAHITDTNRKFIM